MKLRINILKQRLIRAVLRMFIRIMSESSKSFSVNILRFYYPIPALKQISFGKKSGNTYLPAWFTDRFSKYLFPAILRHWSFSPF